MNSNLITSFLTQKHRRMRLIGLDKQQELPEHVKCKTAIKGIINWTTKTSLTISWSIDECINKTTEKDVRKQLIAKISVHVNRG